ncbi:MAG: CNNM domain-containing protein, partial [Gammaproteobacteria bacterium]
MGDDQSISLLLGLLFFLLILSALTSCSEAALLAVNRYRLKHKALKGNKAAILTEKLLEKPDRLIGLILLINNAVNVSSASIVTLITLRIGGEGALVIGSI